ncbi:DUF6702 family protein [Thalassotalea aquiviva]|uniref:DUF6702 family protein n=1 Tax=Thalassotalea aquiviva TaxID=3242415 RepID=UPI00352BBEDB
MRIIFFCFYCLATLTSSMVFAHQQKEAYTTVLFNDRTGNIEVSHRFYLHDAEHALGKTLKKQGDLYASRETQQDFANYIQQQFRLADDKQRLLPLGSVGFEVEGKFFWVYQEIAKPDHINGVYIQMRALQDVWPGQINQINVDHGGKTRSVRLSINDTWQKISID